MADDLYKSPSFQFYPDDFIADTADLTPEEVGAYLRLLCHQWKQGCIPGDTRRQAAIVGISSQKMKKTWGVLLRFFEKVEGGLNVFQQPRLERVRESALEHSKRQSERGKAGAEARWGNGASIAQAMPEQCVGNAQAMPSTMLADGSPISDLPIVPNGTGEASPKQPSLPAEKPSDLAAWQILDAAWPVVSGQHELAIGRKDWRSYNKRAAKALADNGRTPEQVAAMLTLAYTHPAGSKFYGGITTLDKLIAHWPKLAALEDEPDPNESLTDRAIRLGAIRVY